MRLRLSQVLPPQRALAVLAISALVLTASSCGGSTNSSPTAPQLLVAAASDLRPAFEELAWQFSEDTDINVTFSFGSSGQLREQIINGAPFDVFASANAEFVDDVINAGRAIEATKTPYALGRIVLWSASPQNLPANITELQDPRYTRIAIANPTHAPYGLAAQQAFESAGIWNAVQNKLVYGENILDTKQIIESGNVDVGVIALSLAIADGRDYVLIPDSLHVPLLQAAVVTASGNRVELATQWISYMSSPPGLQILAKYGFVRP